MISKTIIILEGEALIEDKEPDAAKVIIHPLLEELRENPIAGNGNNFYFNSFDKTRIFYRIWKPLKEVEKIVIVSHGMGGHGEFFVLLADKLVNHGIMVISPDYRDHGYSGGEKGDLKSFKLILKDLSYFLKFIKEEYPGIPVFLFGESMGGITTINFAKHYPNDFIDLSGLILFSPGIKPNISKKLWLGIALIALPLLIFRVLFPSKKVYSTESDKDEGIKSPIHQRYDKEEPLHIKKLSIRYVLQVFKYMRKTSKIAPLISIPTIIFQGKLDKGISPEAVEKFYEKLGSDDKELHMIEGGYHALITDPSFQDKWEILLEWVNTR